MPRGPSLDLKQHIRDRVAAAPGTVWTPVDFLDVGPRDAVDKALQRLAQSGDIRRIDRGLYDKPRFNSLTRQPDVPDARAVIDAVARRDQARLVVDGITAANDLGFTTAVPAQVVVQTDARLRPIKLGDQEIRFRQAAPSRLFWAGRPAMRVVQALYWLHDVIEANPEPVREQLRHVLACPRTGKAIRDDLIAGLPTLPIWMQTFVRGVLDEAHEPASNGSRTDQDDHDRADGHGDDRGKGAA